MIHHLSLAAQRDLLQSKQCSSVELIEAHLEEIDRRNPEINAFVRIFSEEAREAAKSPKSGPLSGVALTVKDSFDVEGFPTYAGTKLRLDHQATKNSWVVQRLRDAGAILLGKTNTPEFLMNYESDNLITGRTNHPADSTLTPGGSSGGEAAAIASFMSGGGVGSDGGGSIRWPAHCCGIVGLKPTPGRVSAAGHFPTIAHPGGLLGVAGPMARTVEDVRILFDVLKGYDINDPFSAPVVPEKIDREKIRIGVWPQFYKTPVQSECHDAVLRAAAQLSDAGYIVENFEPRGLERAPQLWAFFFVELAAPFLREMVKDRREQTHWTGLELVDRVQDLAEPTGRKVVEMLAARDAMRTSLINQMQQYQVILTAGAGMTAFPHQSRSYTTPDRDIDLFEGTFPLIWANLLGLPALAVGGAQLVGAPWSEELLLDVGEALNRT